jgi:protein-L-isoaspartate O-methyltransferase
MSERAFNPLDPYPLTSMSYQEAQKHSELVDSWLDLRTREIETELTRQKNVRKHQDHEWWIGLPIHVLLTPYTELRKMLFLLNPSSGSKVVDLGAGYGRMGFVLSTHYPEVSFIGYEIVGERAKEAKRCLEYHGCQKSKMLCEDLSANGFEPAIADFYFIYDYGSRVAISKTLNDLRMIARGRSIAVVGRGRLSRDLIEQENPWLSGVNAPEHHGNFSIYRS